MATGQTTLWEVNTQVIANGIPQSRHTVGILRSRNHHPASPRFTRFAAPEDGKIPFTDANTSTTHDPVIDVVLTKFV